MEQQNLNYYCPADELDEELTIDLKKLLNKELRQR